VHDPEALARELARVLEPAGRLYLSTPNIRFAGHLRTLVLGGRFPLTSDDPRGFQGGHIHFLTFRDAEEILRSSGFERVERHGLFAGRARRVARLAPASLAREFLAVGVFVVAIRGSGPVPPLERPATGPRTA
jgi:SAM-dependent methyltransferase